MHQSIIRTCLLLVLVGFVFSARSEDAFFTHAGRIVAVGDLHGDYEQYVRILKANDLVDQKLRWAGAETHFVQLGDVTDRGPDSLKIIRHLMQLEKQAKRAGGRVHVLVGNHEAMNIQTDLRYVHPGEYAALVTRRSAKNQQLYVEAMFSHLLTGQPELAGVRDATILELEERFPLGYVEHRQLWQPGQELARWYADQQAVIQINDTIFLHGGLDPHPEVYPTLAEINETISEELSPGGVPVLSTSDRGPLWYRGLAEEPAETLQAPLQRMLAHYGARRIMIAHTPTAGAVMPRLDGRVIMADVGISAYYGGALANVVIEDDRVLAMHRGQLFELPDDAGLRLYLSRLVELEPADSRLSMYLKSLDQPAADGPARGMP